MVVMLSISGHQQSTIQDAKCSKMLNNGGMKGDVHEAWQMMNKAKTMKYAPDI